MKIKSRTASVIASLLAGVLLAGCGTGETGTSDNSQNTATEKTKITIGMMSSSDVIPYVLMKDKGIVDKYDFELDLQVFTSAKDRDAAFQAGELDGVLTDYVGVYMYQNADFDVRITGITDGDYILLAGKDTGITDISQIKGKSIAISENTLIEYALDTILTTKEMAVSDVVKEVVPRIPDRLELLRNNKIDLVLMPEPFATLALADGAVKLGTANDIGLYPAISAFSKKALDSKTDAIKNLYKAYNEAVEYMNSKDIREYEETVIKAVGYPEEMIGKVEVKDFRKSALPPAEDLEKAGEWVKNKGLYNKSLSYDDLTFDVYK